ncbi:alpha/beta fold hydrolase [Castellaniella ginsengisoli]|jgi:pimeloyl-ACP methyl ester carboxylesterase|uniref:Alpha/beta fold hydrolase n=2 Tax=Castellaniella ginsengisoli TaxID=546114 RepID=A0AB39EE25_9BURK
MMHAPRTYVLIHGAWHGGWCWSRVAGRLRRHGHRVCTPTLPGLGERRHEPAGGIGLETFIQDVCDTLTREHLRDVILVGHSFGGLAVAGAADRLPGRIRRLVFLDAFLLPPGVSAFDTLPADVVAKLESRAADSCSLASPRPDSLGLTDPADIAYVQERLTPHPIGTYREPLRLAHPLGNGLPVTYLRCVQPLFPGVSQAYSWARGTYGDLWSWAELACGHEGMIDAPERVAEALLAAD